MISRIRGTLIRRDVGLVEVMTSGGVAYQMEIPLTVYEQLPREGADVELRTFQVVRPDAILLFGFLDDVERALFARLLTASGVGTKLALNMLSTLPPRRLIGAIVGRDIAALRQIPGFGTKKAERLALELGDRLGELAADVAGGRVEGRTAEEAVSALVVLGYAPAEAAAAVRRALDDRAEIGGIDLIKAALGALGTAR